MKKISAMHLFVALLLGAFSQISSAEETTLNLFTEQYPPYSMTTTGQPFAHSGDEIDGLCPSIVKQLFKNAGIPYHMRLRNWSYGQERVQRRKDNGLFCAVRNEVREKQYQWVGPLTEMRGALFALADSKIKLANIEDARKYRIGGYKGDYYADYLIAKGFDINVAPSDQENPKRLQLGTIDLWISDALAGPYLAADLADMNDVKNVLTYSVNPVYLAINLETDPAIVAKLQDALEKMRKSGELDTLQSAYGM
ncbi:substrate-binding periplasmic protein [Oceanobacter mangrovi]|uniref:substrate-binding periplasmic protein n=1 Tax=Oceanobacter mangrovi TaxID=2862510 RepID=UPI001C8DB3F3|nr:transporter substrate-binding domain-containing protein [Oceanobacter mangrovi]